MRSTTSLAGCSPTRCSTDIDIVYINRYGFPEVPGGPMFWADRMGLDVVLKKIEGFREKYGDFWTPAPLLERLAG